MKKSVLKESFKPILYFLLGSLLLLTSFNHQQYLLFKLTTLLLGTLAIAVNIIKLLVIVATAFGKSKQSPATLLKTSSKPFNVEKWRTVFSLFGLLLATLLCFTAFTWKGETSKTIVLEGMCFLPDVVEFEPPITKPLPPLPPPPPPAPPIIVTVPNEEVVTDEPEIEDHTVDFNEEIEIPDPDLELQKIEKEMKEEFFNTKPEVVLDEPEIIVFEFAQQMPEFIGGEAALLKFLYKKISYPDVAKKNGIEGTVFVSFVVNEDGKISDVEILRDIGGTCGDAAKAVIEQMPNWKPGYQNGEAIKVRMRLPVKFDIIE